MAISILLLPWRPNEDGPEPQERDDRELVRQYLGWPASESSLEAITTAMNGVAAVSVAAVAKVQAWINEVEDLETGYAEQVASGTAHLQNAQEYEGPLPGATISRDQQLKKADVLEWDTSLLKVKVASGGTALSTATGVLQDRIQQLKSRVIAALGLETTAIEGDPTSPLYRS